VLQAQLLLGLTFLALETQDNLSCGLCLFFVKRRVWSVRKSHLLGIVPALALGKVGRLSCTVSPCVFMLLHLRHRSSVLLLWYIFICGKYYGDNDKGRENK
jgi:hypothetical protein